MVSGSPLQVECLTSVVLDLYFCFVFLRHPYYVYFYFILFIYLFFFFFYLIASSGKGEGGSQYHSSNLNGYIRSKHNRIGF